MRDMIRQCQTKLRILYEYIIHGHGIVFFPRKNASYIKEPTLQFRPYGKCHAYRYFLQLQTSQSQTSQDYLWPLVSVTISTTVDSFSVTHTHTHEKNETRLLLYTPIVTIVLRLISWAWLAHCNTRNNYLYWETVCGVDNLQVCYRWRRAANQDPACSGPQ